MKQKLISPISGGFVPGTTWIHLMRADYKIKGTLGILALSGMADGILLSILTVLALGLARLVNFSMREIYLMMRKMTWFFIAIIIFPVMFTPGYFLELPAWIPIRISVEGLTLASESCVRLIIVVLISSILIRTTLLTELDSLVSDKGRLGKKLREIIQIAVMSIEVMPLIFQKAECQLADFSSQNYEKRTLLKTIRFAAGQVIPFIVSVFSKIEVYDHQRDAGLKQEI